MSSDRQATLNCVDWMVDRHVRAGRGDHPALVECGKQGRRVLTYAQLQTVIAGAAPATGAGGRARRIAIVGSSTLEAVCGWLATMRGGGLPFVIHPGLSAGVHRDLLADFAADDVHRDRTGPPEVAASALAEVIASPPGAVSRTPAPIATAAPGDPAFCLASSGSTGRPKICVHGHGAVPTFHRHVTGPLWQMDETDIVLGSSGPYFSFGLQGIHTALSLGATAVLLPDWQRHEDFLAAIEAEAVTTFLGVPTLYHLMMTRASRAYRTGTLRRCLSAGERLPEAIRTRWATYAGAPLIDSIGTTETFLPYLTEVPGQGAGMKEVGGFAYAYTPLERDERAEGAEGAEGAEVADRADAGQFATTTVSLSGSPMMLGYLAPGTRGELQLQPPPHFDTGDVFASVPGGWSFVSRRSERVKIAGHWVTPQALEEFLLSDGRVLQAAAVPVTTYAGLQRMRAYIVLRDGCREGDAVIASLTRRMREELRPNALRPDRIEVVPALASSPNGKLQRRELAAAVAARRLGGHRGMATL